MALSRPPPGRRFVEGDLHPQLPLFSNYRDRPTDQVSLSILVPFPFFVGTVGIKDLFHSLSVVSTVDNPRDFCCRPRDPSRQSLDLFPRCGLCSVPPRDSFSRLQGLFDYIEGLPLPIWFRPPEASLLSFSILRLFGDWTLTPFPLDSRLSLTCVIAFAEMIPRLHFPGVHLITTVENFFFFFSQFFSFFPPQLSTSIPSRLLFFFFSQLLSPLPNTSSLRSNS